VVEVGGGGCGDRVEEGEYLYSVHMYVNGKMGSVETTLGMGEGR
jgi:hypothetical protein